MPEYPEIYTVVNNLKEKLVGKTISKIEVLYKNVFYDYNNEIVNKTIKDIRQMGKYILFFISDNVLISHLRMEGKYAVKDKYEPGKHTLLVMHLSSGDYVEYNDTRKFGRFELRTISNYLNTLPLSELGKTPYKLTGKELYNLISKRNLKIKQALLNQKIISGIGNIYADEILFDTKISPTRNTKDITLTECENIINSSIKIFDKSIDFGGTTIRTYSSLGEKGSNQNNLKVHTRKGEPCPVCGTIIEKITVAGRGTYYCRNCQK